LITPSRASAKDAEVEKETGLEEALMSKEKPNDDPANAPTGGRRNRPRSRGRDLSRKSRGPVLRKKI
jgi:hypothetical protein